jgi:dihydrolipoamide dehydrogenase
LLNSAKLYAHALQSEQFGVTASGVRIDWGQAQAWKAKVVKTLVAGVGGALKRAGVSVVKEFGHLDGPGRVSAGGDAHTADHVIIATGSEPVWPPIPGVQDNPKVVDSTGLLAIDSLPERLVVIGGGVIGVEFASLFAMLGAKVDVVELLPEVLPFMDAELASKLRPAVPGVTFHLGCRVTEVEGAAVKYTDAQGQRQSLPADVVLMAVGRRRA